ncbi:hypothetical protein GCM10010381_60790 [Streptomyces xantholiticus]|nr:hypothetical protein [Streptomyces xantholiticus]GGW67663.1 hypothetical protein GCM10010381_60790 [Streptomyces xantholiticus]
MGDSTDHVHNGGGHQGRNDVVDWTVAERDDVDGVGPREADERLLVDFVGVLGLEDGLIADAGPMRENRTGRRPSTPPVAEMPRLSA